MSEGEIIIVLILFLLLYVAKDYALWLWSEFTEWLEYFLDRWFK